MPAIEPHETETRGGSWDGNENEARVLTDQDFEYYARIYAWKDPEKEENLKSAYRFIHHFVGSSGEPGPASIVACRAGIGILNGARGGTTIPDRDRPGVWRHLAKHLEDAGLEAPPLQEPREIPTGSMEYVDIELEREAKLDGKLNGIAWVYSEPDLTGLMFAPGAFRDSIQRLPEVPLLWQHDAAEVIGVARLTDTGRRLTVDATLDMDDPVVRDRIAGKIRRGLVTGLSIGFTVDESDVAERDGRQVRVVKRAQIWEVSVVTFPAHPRARVTNIRSMEVKQMELEAIRQRLEEEAAARGRIEQQIGLLTALLDKRAHEPDSTDLARWLEGHDGLRAMRNGMARSVSLQIPVSAIELYRRAIVYSGAITGGGGIVRERVPDIVVPGRRRVFVRELLQVIPAEANAIEFVRATSEGGTVSPQTETAAKSELAHTWETAVAYVRTIAAWVPASQQILEDIPGMQGFLEGSVAYRVLETEEQQILTGSGTGMDLPGLTTQAQSFDTSLLGTNYTYADCIGRAVQQIVTDGEPEPTFVLLNPADYWTIRLMRGTDGQYVMGPPNVDEVLMRLFGLSVIWTPAISAGYFLVGSNRPDVVVIREKKGMTVKISTEHADYAVRNMVAIIAETRIALVVYRPNAFVYGALAQSV